MDSLEFYKAVMPEMFCDKEEDKTMTKEELEQQLSKKAFIISQLETQLEMVEKENKKLRAKLKEIKTEND